MLSNLHIKYHKIHEALVMFIMLWFTGSLFAQADRKFIRQGNREYEKEKYSESEISLQEGN